MRPPDDQTCSKSDPRVKCVGRHDASLRGDFLFDFYAKGWVWGAFADDDARVWRVCPWCSATLPDVGKVYDRLRAGIYEDAG